MLNYWLCSEPDLEMILDTGVCQSGSRASREGVGLGNEDGTEVRIESRGSGAWRTGSFKPVGDGFDGAPGVLFCL